MCVGNPYVTIHVSKTLKGDSSSSQPFVILFTKAYKYKHSVHMENSAAFKIHVFTLKIVEFNKRTRLE